MASRSEEREKDEYIVEPFLRKQMSICQGFRSAGKGVLEVAAEHGGSEVPRIPEAETRSDAADDSEIGISIN